MLKKSFFSVLLILSMIVYSMCIVSAAEKSNSDGYLPDYSSPFIRNAEKFKGIKPDLTVNEYDNLKLLKEKNTNELSRMGYSTSEINEIKELDYKEELKKRSTYPKENLLNLGYSESEINILRNYDGSEASTRALAATVYMQLGVKSTSSDKKVWTMYYEWGWTKLPVFLSNDVVAIKWLGNNSAGAISNTYRVPGTTYTKLENYYMTSDGSKSVYIGPINGNPTDFDLNILQTRFNLGTRSSHPSLSGTVYNVNFGGYGEVGIGLSAGPIAGINACLAYGHSYVTVSLPSVSMDSKGFGSVALDFTTNVAREAKIIKFFDKAGQHASN